ncbi:MAG: hypothetical protein E7254_10440 [Lachnospiraceae bacterium]|nr:hypothetical protein [Lachnospiraceae bacterium]
MGLLDSIQRKNAEKEMPQTANFEFRSMDEEMRNKILAIYKRLFIRGILGQECEYSAKNNIYLWDEKQNIILFQQGYYDKEEYYCLMIGDEMWRVTVVKKNERQYKYLEVLYIPNKVGKVSNVDTAAENIARQGIHLFFSEEYDLYLNNLRNVLDETLIEEYTKLPDTWYHLLFLDENCKQLLEYKENLTVNLASAVEEIDFLLEFSDEDLAKDISIKAEKKVLSREHVLDPIVNAYNEFKEIKVYKYKKKLPLSINSGVEYYAAKIKDVIAVIAAVEDRESGTITIKKISMSDRTKWNNENISNIIKKGIEKIESINYVKPVVDLDRDIHIVIE